MINLEPEMQQTLDTYLKAFIRLKRGNTPLGIAPHKPVLLLSMIELIDKGMISENKFYIDADLVGTFKENWNVLVDTLHQADFTQPFYHLQNDKVAGRPFWFLIPYPGCQINAPIKSVTTLAVTVAWGCFADDLFQVLSDRVSRSVIRQAILDTYFPLTKLRLKAEVKGNSYLDQLEDDVLNGAEVRSKRVKIDSEEDVFVRGGLFKKLIPKVYSYTCSFSGMLLRSVHGHSFIDACHIVPFSISRNDTIGNGIALCPNMHRAFDRGLLTLDEDYRVVVSRCVIENDEHPYSLGRLHGRASNLPDGEKCYPSQDNLEWHREQVFKG